MAKGIIYGLNFFNIGSLIFKGQKYEDKSGRMKEKQFLFRLNKGFNTTGKRI